MRSISLFLLVAIAGCATVNNTVDNSRTVSRKGPAGSVVGGVAVASIPESSAAEGLSRDLGLALPAAIREALPGVAVIGPTEFGTALQRRKGYLAHFAKWRSIYEQTGVLDPRPLAHYSRAAGGVTHLLLVRSTNLDREKVSLRDALRAAPCRRLFCTAQDSDNIWETRLKVLAELIDLRTGGVAWRGVGEAVRVQQGSPRLDFGLFIIDRSKGPGVEDLAEEMVGIAAEGIASQIGGSRSLASLH